MSVLLQTTFFSPAGLPQITMQLLIPTANEDLFVKFGLGNNVSFLYIVYFTLCVPRYTLET